MNSLKSFLFHSNLTADFIQRDQKQGGVYLLLPEQVRRLRLPSTVACSPCLRQVRLKLYDEHKGSMSGPLLNCHSATTTLPLASEFLMN